MLFCSFLFNGKVMRHNFSISICRDRFWDTNLTWYSEQPEFTECFQNLVFVILPCLVFWLSAVAYLCVNRKQTANVPLPWTWLNVTKLFLCLILICVSGVQLGLEFYRKHDNWDIPDVELYTSGAKILTYVLLFIIMIRNRLIGNQTSTFLSLFWLVMTFCGIILFRSAILRSFYNEYVPILKYQYLPDMIYYPVIFLQFLLSFFTDKAIGTLLEEKNPFETCSFYSFLTFQWFDSIIMKGRRKVLTIQDYPPLPSAIVSRPLWNKFEPMWIKELQRHKRKSGNTNDKTLPRLGWITIKCVRYYIIIAFLLHSIQSVLVFAAPLLLDLLLAFIVSDDYVWKGYLFSIAMLASQMAPYFCYIFMLQFSNFFGLQIQSILSSAIYRKALRLSNTSRQKFPTGEIVNLVSVDVDKIFNFTVWSSFAVGCSLKIIFTIGFLWLYLGPACLTGVGVLIVLIGVSTISSKMINKLQDKQMEIKDSRLKFMTEILNGIKVLKFYAWELPFMKKITDLRVNEVYYIRYFQLIYAVFSFMYGSTSFLVAIGCFVTYILINKEHVLTPTLVFVSLNLFNILRSAVLNIPSLTTDFVQTYVSTKRIARFLAAEEHDTDAVGNNPDSGDAISIKNGSFAWEKNREPILKDIELHVPKKSLVAIIGPVGCGKSSLLSSILGEMYKLSGNVEVEGEIAYVPQQAWVMNQTLKDNILFIRPMNEYKYETIIDSSCLRPDLEILPAKDQTEIGEKGVNLSGGQKQRVSLARAIYHDAELYLLDDPLSAVDAHVGKHIFEHVIGKNGLLKNKSRILVTHNISVLAKADYIYTMKDGCIKEHGTYKDLMDRNGYFSELIQEFGHTQELAEEDKLIDIETTDEVLPIQSINADAKNEDVPKNGKNSVGLAGRLVEEEKMEMGEVKMSVIITYIKHMSYFWFISMCLGYIGNQCLDIGANVWLSEWSNDKPTINGTYEITLRNERIEVYTGMGLAQAIMMVVGSASTAFGAARAAKLFHRKMLDSVMKSPMSFFDVTPAGRILNRFGRDIEDIDQYVPELLDMTLFQIFSFIGTIAVISSKLPLFLPFLIPIGAIGYIIQKFYLHTTRQIRRITSTTRSPIYSHFTESIQGASSISAYNVAGNFIERLEEKVNTNNTSVFMLCSATRWLDIRTAILGNFITFLTSVLAVVSRDKISVQFVGLAVTYALSISDALRFLIRHISQLETRAVAVERVLEYSNLTPEAPWDIPETEPTLDWPAQGKVELKNFSTKYRENLDLVLTNVSLDIDEKQKIGIVGRTGAGKSSVTLSLFRIIEPVTGTIVIDDIDVSQIGLHSLRSKLTIIPQDPVLFNGPLRFNLDPNDDYTDEEIWSSLEHSSLRQFVSSLPEGLSHEVAEGGSNLSVGQRQLLCLARALLRKTKILILDEATAAVDVETDRWIQNTIRTEFKEHTIITIAHRLNTILDYDRVCVMDSGRITELGNPNELLQEKSSNFYSMAKDAGLV